MTQRACFLHAAVVCFDKRDCMEEAGNCFVQRLENWKLLRAFLWPNFLRSTMRASRVR